MPTSSAAASPSSVAHEVPHGLPHGIADPDPALSDPLPPEQAGSIRAICAPVRSGVAAIVPLRLRRVYARAAGVIFCAWWE